MSQISPNPNYGIITVTEDNYNSVKFLNFRQVNISEFGTLTNNAHLENWAGTITNSGTLTNNDYLENYYGTITNSGTLTNNVHLENYAGTITNNGTLTNNAHLENYAGTITNNGTLTNNYSFSNTYGTVTNDGTLTNNYSFRNDNATITNNGTFTNNDAFFGLRGTVTNDGTLTNNKSFSNTYGTVTNNGTFTNNDYFESYYNTVTNDGTLTNKGTFVNAHGTITNNGIFINNGFCYTFEGSFVNNGTVAGTGVFYADLSGGTVSPGNEVDNDGTFTIDRNFNLGNLTTSISGLDAGDFDVLQVNGVANLLDSGSLSFSFDESGLKNDIAEGGTKSLTFLKSSALNNSLNLASFAPTDDGDNGADFDFVIRESGNDLVLDITRQSISNTAPITTDDLVSTSKSTAVTIDLSDNISDREGLVGASFQFTDENGGTVTLIDPETSLVTFTPSVVGTASFKYSVTDAGGLKSNTSTVTVNVGDVISTGNQSQDITGNDGNDYISAGNGKDILTGLGGNDTLLGNNGVDKLYGGAGKDILSGGNGDDLLDGGSGDDLLTGGNGSDCFVLAAQGGTDTITDFLAGTDFIALSGGLSFNSLGFSGSDIINASTNETLATLTGVSTSTLTANNFVTV